VNHSLQAVGQRLTGWCRRSSAEVLNRFWHTTHLNLQPNLVIHQCNCH